MATNIGVDANRALAASADGSSKPAKFRDDRIDVFRGLALFIIVVEHMGGNWLIEAMPMNFGFTSGADIFVFCSGMASALAFGSLFVKRGLWLGTVRVAYRIWQIYWAHLCCFMVLAALTFFVAGWFGRPKYIEGLQLNVLLFHPKVAILGAVTLSYLPPLSDILPMYIVMLALVPLVMLARRLSPVLPFVVVGGIYLYVWTIGVTLPGNPITHSHWLFDPFAWQLLFFTGFFIAMKWVPTPAVGTPWATWAAAAVVLVAVPLNWHVLTDNVPVLGAIHNAILPMTARYDFHILRFVHILSLGYLAVSAVAYHRVLILNPAARVVALVGRQTLPVFLSSIPIAILGGTAVDIWGASAPIVISATALSWGAIIVVAYVADYMKSAPWKAPIPVAVPAPAEARGSSAIAMSRAVRS